MNFEFPLVFFTVFSQLAVGIAIFICCYRFAHSADEATDEHIRRAWIWTCITGFFALLASLAHLGHPFQAYKVLNNLGASWLSKEAVLFGCFCGMSLLNIFWRPAWFSVLTTLAGCAAIVAEGLTYAVPAVQAIYNAFPMALYCLSAIALGATCAKILLKQQNDVVDRLSIGCLLAIILVAPCIWLSGSLVFNQSGTLWLSSPVFWFGIVLLALALYAAIFKKISNILQFASLICGLLLTRMVFFADTVSTTTLIGMPF